MTTPHKQLVDIELPYRVNISELESLTSGSVRVTSLKFRCENALDALKEGNKAEARRYLELAANIDTRFADYWLLMAAAAETPDEQEAHLEKVLAYEQNDLAVIEALAILRGDLQPDARQPKTRRLEEGEVPFKEIMCPQCRGRLYYHEGDHDVRCNFCDFLVLDADGMPRTKADNQTPLVIGMLKRKYRPKDWNIGTRWLRCNSCGAVTTLSRQTLTNTCRFCDSRQVRHEGVDSHLEQPDIIVPFQIGENYARQAIRQKLKSGIRMITRFFADPVEHIKLHAVYLPFWVFEGDAQVSWRWTNASASGVYPVLLEDILYFAAESPSRRMLENIEPFNLRNAVDYDPRLLAVHPAGLYSMDVDQASIEVRTKIAKLAQRKARSSTITMPPTETDVTGNYQSPGRLVLHARTNYLSYRFALLPVWIGTLIETDGDTRQLVVNGQTGAVALGRLEKAT